MEKPAQIKGLHDVDVSKVPTGQIRYIDIYLEVDVILTVYTVLQIIKKEDLLQKIEKIYYVKLENLEQRHLYAQEQENQCLIRGLGLSSGMLTILE